MQAIGISVGPNKTFAQFYRRKAFAIAVLLTAAIAISAAIGFILLSRQTLAENLVTFTCSTSDGATMFSVAVDVNITDGLDENEAIKITNKVFERMPDLDGWSFQGFSVKCNRAEDGVWNVRSTLTLTRLIMPKGHTVTLSERLIVSYDMVINPFDQTVKYTRSSIVN